MSENLRNFTKAVYSMDAVVQRVPTEAWDNPSPCDGWTARDVVGHQLGVLAALAEMARGSAMVLPHAVEDMSEPGRRWAEGRDNVLAALDTPEALHHEGEYWFGPMSIDGLVGVVQWDPLTHAWDVAQAAGIEAALDPVLAQRSYDMISRMRDALSGMKLLGDPVDVPDDAPIVDRYLGLVGRDPAR